ncbi:uncharacterized protein LOC141657509 [Silene latifolia]|uniref:uncharacterized protein LOC141657509 n=1 Tax=Silene latifolia TaxID=37657 RepID=UPI003D77A123
MSLKFVLRKLTTMAEDEPPPSSSDTDIAKLVLNKLGETLEEFHSRALPVLSLSEQLDSLQSSLAMTEVEEGGFCEKCKEMRVRERELVLRETRLNESCRKLVLREKRVEEEYMACCEQLRLKKEELVESRRAQGKQLELELDELSKKWEDLESKEKKIKEGFETLKSKELILKRKGKKGFVSKKKRVLEEVGLDLEVGRCRMSDLELEEKEMSVCLKLLEMREAKINELIEAGSENKETRGNCRAREDEERVIDENRKRIKFAEKEMNDNLGALELKVKKLEEYRDELERKHCQAMELSEKQLNQGLDAIDAKAKEVDERIKEMNVRCQDVGMKEKNVNRLMRDLEMREEKLKERYQLVELREKQLNQGLDAIDAKVAERRKEMELYESEINARKQKVGTREKVVSKLMRVLETREAKFKEHCKAQASKEKEIDEKSNKIELKLQELDQRYMGLKLQEKELRSLHEAKVVVEKALTEKLKAMESKANNDVEDADQILILCKAMSGRNLQMLLNDRFMEHQSMMEKLCNALKQSNDPAKLVLSAIYGFYPPHLERPGSSGFDTRAVRTSCVLLLEYLMNMNACVSEAVKNEAIWVARRWRHGMVAEGITSIVVLGFLLLLAAYNLGSNYEATELQGFYEMIYHHRLASDIGVRLGLSKPKNDMQSDLIDRRKGSATSMEFPGEDKRVDPLDASQMFMPYNPTGALYGPPPNSVPFQQYPAWPHGATPATCNCVPPFWCSWCRPPPYNYTYVSQ